MKNHYVLQHTEVKHIKRFECLIGQTRFKRLSTGCLQAFFNKKLFLRPSSRNIESRTVETTQSVQYLPRKHEELNSISRIRTGKPGTLNRTSLSISMPMWKFWRVPDLDEELQVTMAAEGESVSSRDKLLHRLSHSKWSVLDTCTYKQD